MSMPLAFHGVDFEAGRPVVRVRYVCHHNETVILGFPLAALEELLQIAYNALGGAPGGSNPQGVRTPPRRRVVRTASVEEKARATWAPGMSVSQLERAAGISRSAAAKYARLLSSAVDL